MSSQDLKNRNLTGLFSFLKCWGIDWVGRASNLSSFFFFTYQPLSEQFSEFSITEWLKCSCCLATHPNTYALKSLEKYFLRKTTRNFTLIFQLAMNRIVYSIFLKRTVEFVLFNNRPRSPQTNSSRTTECNDLSFGFASSFYFPFALLSPSSYPPSLNRPPHPPPPLPKKMERIKKGTRGFQTGKNPRHHLSVESFYFLFIK